MCLVLLHERKWEMVLTFFSSVLRMNFSFFGPWRGDGKFVKHGLSEILNSERAEVFINGQLI